MDEIVNMCNEKIDLTDKKCLNLLLEYIDKYFGKLRFRGELNYENNNIWFFIWYYKTICNGIV